MSRKQKRSEDRAKFRVMHHRFHDEPDWHVEEPKDLMGSVMSDNKKYIDKKFKEEFNSGGSGSGKKKGQQIHLKV